MSTDSEMRSCRDSWPPTQLRLEPHGMSKGNDPRPLLDDMDDDPLTYFLTPTPGLEDGDTGGDGMDFDAGIEDASNPHEPVRSVSPSTLNGLSKPSKGRPASPDFDSDAMSPDDDDDDDDDEDYFHFSPNKSRLLSFRDLYIDGLGPRPQSPAFGRSANALLSPASFPAPNARGRSSARSMREAARSLSALSRQPHLWREPSPDVWSIEEETEEEMVGQGGSEDDREGETDGVVHAKATKPKKRVRFVLPSKE